MGDNLSANKSCPTCQSQNTEAIAAAHVEGGKWDEFREEFEYEWDGQYYRCLKCGESFAV